MSDGTTVRRTVYFTMVNHPLKGWVRVGNAYSSRKTAQGWLGFVRVAWRGLPCRVSACTITSVDGQIDERSRKVRFPTADQAERQAAIHNAELGAGTLDAPNEWQGMIDAFLDAVTLQTADGQPIRIADPNESIAVDPAEWLDRDEAVDPLEVAFWLYDEKHKRKDRALSERDAFKIVVRSFWNVESRALLEAFGIEVTTPEPVSIAEDLRQEAALAKAYQAAIQAHEKAKEQT